MIVTRRALVRALLLSALMFLLLPAASASAGRLVATGHDVDDHCGEGDPEPGSQCHYMEVATRYVRGGAPDPSKRVLLLDCLGNTEDALDNAFGSGNVPRKRMCPSEDPDFASEHFSTERYSAIIVGSSCDDENSLNLTSDDVNGCDTPGGTTPDSDEINAREDDFRRFFNDGGGIFAMAGEDNGDGDPTSGPDVYYDFVPIGVQGQQVNPPFCLTQRGIEIGFEDQDCPDPSKHNGTHDDINCCPTHNSFSEPPADSALKVAERDSSGSPPGKLGAQGLVAPSDAPETLVADGRISGGGFEEEPDSNKECLGEKPDIVGTEGDDEIEGTPGSDVIRGRGGDDEIRGVGGNDVICGNNGEDDVFGGDGNDRVSGNRSPDEVNGGKGDDRAKGGPGDDQVNGNKGDDRLRGNPGDDALDGGPGQDRCEGDGGTDSAVGCEAVGRFP